MGRLVTIVAGGYRRQYARDTSEIAAIQLGIWLPSTIDFEATANLTRGTYYSVKDAASFFGAMTAGKTKISRIVFIGHGNPTALCLSASRFVRTAEIAKYGSVIRSKIRPLLENNATLDIVSCKVATKPALMKALATAMGISVRGFSTPLLWHVSWDKNKRITRRGEICRNATCSQNYRGVRNIKFPITIRP